MNDIIDTDTSNRKAEGLKTVGWISYLLHLIVAVAAVVPAAQPSLLLLVIALVIDLVKRSDADGTWQANHFSWRIRSVLWAGVLYVVTFPFFLLGLFLFNPAWILISVWFLYRIVRGMVAMNSNRAVDA
ncbi:MAG: hypothetical protein QE290_09025 [Acidovorax sp.]|uniref:DUF4870 family protein n=1 Tax=Acidovorax sp. TaxID=1872122 RepID=UPI00262E443F|nr:hypothetical protein [Acidovorax sp.]MDH4464160.1 hypothetical protein [Acidovorax sp.]